DKYPANTQYKYYTNDGATDNWENNANNTPKGNRWSIAPIMNDVVERFTTMLTTEVNNVEINARIARTYSGIEVVVDGESTIELYNMNGALIDKARTTSTYTR
ncbi:hypothetical protein JZU68_08825, partial [bacterium]|nr:hypothetical protein [bacterium]